MPWLGAPPADVALSTDDLEDGIVTTAKIAANNVDGTLTKDALIADYSDVTITAADLVMYGDATDSNNTKRDTVQGILDLATGSPRTLIGGTSLTAAAASSITWSSLSGYEVYELIWWNGENVTTGQELQIQFSNSGTFRTSSYRKAIQQNDDSSATYGGEAATNETGVKISHDDYGGGKQIASGHAWIFNLELAEFTTAYVHGINNDQNDNLQFVQGVGDYDVTEAHDGIRVNANGGGNLDGEFALYGYNITSD